MPELRGSIAWLLAGPGAHLRDGSSTERPDGRVRHHVDDDIAAKPLAHVESLAECLRPFCPGKGPKVVLRRARQRSGLASSMVSVDATWGDRVGILECVHESIMTSLGQYRLGSCRAPAWGKTSGEWQKRKIGTSSLSCRTEVNYQDTTCGQHIHRHTDRYGRRSIVVVLGRTIQRPSWEGSQQIPLAAIYAKPSGCSSSEAESHDCLVFPAASICKYQTPSYL